MRRSAALLLASALVVAGAAAGAGEPAAPDAAMRAFNAQDYAVAREGFEALARAGDAEARFLLGVMLLRGLGDDADPAAARDWLRRAAAQGHAAAQFQLAELHRRGIGGSADAGKATRWYERAAESGWFGAQMALAEMYATGNGVRRDPVAAHKWYDIAAEMWLDPYNGARDALAATMSEVEIAEARRRAKAWIATHRRWDESVIAAIAAMSEE